MENGILSEELTILSSFLDEHLDLFCKRIDFLQVGEKNKAKFINERLLPLVDQKIRKQTDVVSKLLEGTI